MTFELENIHYRNDAFIEIGKIIGQQRNRYSVSLKNLSNKLKLRYDVLEMIESGNFKSIDRRINILGYISSICKEIDLDDKILLSKIGFSDPEILEKKKLKNIKEQINQISYSNLKKESIVKIFHINDPRTKKIIGISILIFLILMYKIIF